jgi:K+-sensing histidine kinase KdpD
MPKDERRRTPEDFLLITKRDAAKGKLKIYPGMAAGVGKTGKIYPPDQAARAL